MVGSGVSALIPAVPPAVPNETQHLERDAPSKPQKIQKQHEVFNTEDGVEQNRVGGDAQLYEIMDEIQTDRRHEDQQEQDEILQRVFEKVLVVDI